MRFGFVGSFGTAHQIVEIAVAAEEHGWDGFFTWDAISLTAAGTSEGALAPVDVWDPFALLGAVATLTSRVRLGALVFAVPRREPWKLAREALTVDHLSGGRLVLPVGIGVPDDAAVSTVRGGLAAVREGAPGPDERPEVPVGPTTGERLSLAG